MKKSFPAPENMQADYSNGCDACKDASHQTHPRVVMINIATYEDMCLRGKDQDFIMPVPAPCPLIKRDR
jgi:hypothetical protein